ncbi:MAG: hypothetical protein APF82_10955 [Sphingomonadales bacterium BRH_c42]|nr:MAG: hypothetical protein APF82_10955 [Sphingomonadales bacterium BRH_c42]
MLQTAVFVDAGYLFAAGSSLLYGAKQPRTACQLDIDQAVETICEFARSVESDARLLRIYWYDGIKPYSGPSTEQMALGQKHNVKLRLGMLNSQGQQKGVDSLIITDLIDLARNKALSDALILAGDEDLRVGVQVAQSFGVRVHLLGVSPTRGNVSPHLMQEIDSLSELTADHVRTFLTCRIATTEPASTIGKLPLAQSEPQNGGVINFNSIVQSILGRFNDGQMATFKQHLVTSNSLPREVDAPILAQARHELNRDLTIDEKRMVRAIAREALEK